MALRIRPSPEVCSICRFPVCRRRGQQYFRPSLVNRLVRRRTGLEACPPQLTALPAGCTVYTRSRYGLQFQQNRPSSSP